MELGSSFLFLQEQIKDIIIIRPSLCLLAIAHSSMQKRHQVRSARVRRHTVFDNLAPLPEYSAHILVPPRGSASVSTFLCEFFLGGFGP